MRKSYSEYQFMHIFLDKFRQGVKFTAHISIHQAELRREENFTDQNILSISYLHTDYLNIDISSGAGRKMREKILFQTNICFLEVLTIMQKH